MLIQADETPDQDGDIQRSDRGFQRGKRLCGRSHWRNVSIAQRGDRHEAEVVETLPGDLRPIR